MDYLISAELCNIILNFHHLEVSHKTLTSVNRLGDFSLAHLQSFTLAVQP